MHSFRNGVVIHSDAFALQLVVAYCQILESSCWHNVGIISHSSSTGLSLCTERPSLASFQLMQSLISSLPNQWWMHCAFLMPPPGVFPKLGTAHFGIDGNLWWSNNRSDLRCEARVNLSVAVRLLMVSPQRSHLGFIRIWAMWFRRAEMSGACCSIWPHVCDMSCFVLILNSNPLGWVASGSGRYCSFAIMLFLQAANVYTRLQ